MLGIFILCILLVSLVSGEMLVSDAGVEYESRILEEFAKLNGTNETFVEIIIYLKDFSEVDALVSNFSEDELRDVINRQIPNRSSERIGAEITEKGFYKLIQDERVEKVYYNLPVYGSLSESAPLINADDARNTLGYTGDDVKVCIIDTGIDTNHPDLSARIVDEYCYCDNNCCPDDTDEDDSAEDDNGHGTHVAGIIASEDSTYKGVAFGVNIYVVK